ncbi:MAG: hypothetical protein MZV63_24135 [Marinilabiliales bacterium]|nr:hypothetical protein [Marinilabiliales bacterium]
MHYAKKSMLPEFDGVDSGNDDLLNRILWFACKRAMHPIPQNMPEQKRSEERWKSLRISR